MNRLPELIEMVLTRPHLDNRKIGRALSRSPETVRRYRRLLAHSHIAHWDEVKDFDGATLDALLNANQNRGPRLLHPDYAAMGEALRQPGVTLLRLHAEFVAANPHQRTVAYAQMARCFGRHVGPSSVMRQQHVPGYAVQVDFSGKRPSYKDPQTGEVVKVELFVAVLPFSNLIFACCTASQTVPDWIEANNRMVRFYGGVPQVVVPDNLKSAITKAGREPTVQKTYLDWAKHYGTAIVPARAGHPRDKGAVEGAVRIVQQHMLPELAKETLFSLTDLDAAVADLLPSLNNRPFQKRQGSRRIEFNQNEKAALQPLPAQPYVFRLWCSPSTVPKDYHLEVCDNFYSVPHGLVGQVVEARYTLDEVEVHHLGKLVARHPRLRGKGAVATDRAHQPPEHQAQAESGQAGLVAWANSVGPSTGTLMRGLFKRKIPMEGLLPGRALRNLAKDRETAVFEAACAQALANRAAHPTGVKRVLDLAKATQAAAKSKTKGTRVPLNAASARRGGGFRPKGIR